MRKLEIGFICSLAEREAPHYKLERLVRGQSSAYHAADRPLRSPSLHFSPTGQRTEPIATIEAPRQEIANLEVGIAEHKNKFRAQTPPNLHCGASN